MSKDDLPPACKQQRFKGVESFLRRLAFNLGNTPSQTEVKIISCIPIDVTDLQQKIITLEKELFETKVLGVSPQRVKSIEKKSDSPTVNISSALYGSAIGKPSTTVSHCNVKPESIKSQKTLSHCCDCLKIPDKSNVSFTYPACSTQGTEQSCRFASAENSNTMDSKNKLMNTECYRNIFKKRKRKKMFKDKLRPKTQLVYYAQTPNIPFNQEIPHHDESNKINVLSHTYLEDIFRKHHDPKLIVEEYSDTSHFSKPICRDATHNWRQCCTNASDVCSCCHGRFQNVDNYLDKCINFETKNTNQLESYNKSNKFEEHYDMIPVKEKSIKQNTDSLPKFENYINMKCWPERIRTKHRYHPFIVNYELEMPIKRKPDKNEQFVKKRESPKHNNKRERLMKINQSTGIETSKSDCIDCGNIYEKPVLNAITQSFPYKNECVATDVLYTNVKTSALNNQTDSSTVDNTKTEITLNQIKNILQSVLTEVKTNSNINNTAEEVVKKDAMIQKGTSHNNMQGASTLLHSFTYNNSYNANPYLASCSRQIPSAPYCYPSMPCEHGKYLQNFPVFIQPAPGRHMCACYYRNSAHKTSHSKRATTAGTNTDRDIKESNSKETEKLIKEIYKSIALNMEYPNRDNSVTEYDDFKATDNSSMTSDAKDIVDTSVEVTEGSTKRDKEVDVIISPLVSNTTESKLVYTAMSSQTVSQKLKMVSRDQSIDTEFEEGRTFHRSEENRDEIYEDDDTDESSSIESDDTVVPENEDGKNKKEKSGFFQKVFKSVFKKKGKKIEREAAKSAASDSDDYETVYSEKVDKTPTYSRNKRRKPTYRRQATDANYVGVKRTPYMEQEYRRQWNENLIFHDNRDSRRPVSRPMTGRRRYNQPYWQEYEARPAMVEPIPTYYRTVPSTNKVEQGTDVDGQMAKEKIPIEKKNLTWLKKHKLGIHCGEQWKKLILEN